MLRVNFSATLQIEGEQNNSPIPGSFANGTGQFEFRLDRLHGNNHVPDAGSPLGLLGMALCTLGGIARREPNPSGWDWSEAKALAVNGR
jgi:hypothetical protein